jgi:hypothetical protein
MTQGLAESRSILRNANHARSANAAHHTQHFNRGIHPGAGAAQAQAKQGKALQGTAKQRKLGGACNRTLPHSDVPAQKEPCCMHAPVYTCV